MKEKNLLSKYPQPKMQRVVSEKLRTVEHRIVASKRGQEFFDGNRNCGYGGFTYDGRWKPIASDIISNYNLENNSNVLQINSEKGFLLHDIRSLNPKINVFGTETSDYAISQTVDDVKDKIVLSNPTQLPFNDNYFDFVLNSIGIIFMQTIMRFTKLHSAASYLSSVNYLSRTIIVFDCWQHFVKIFRLSFRN